MLIYYAAFNAYNNFIKMKTNRSFILYINIPLNEIGINIHPTKNQIKFYKPSEIYIFVYNTILNLLNKNKYSKFIYDISLKNQKNIILINVFIISLLN
ncbi:hypothetical protein [Buchnera aphidicola]|uniref:hypothetical protein n=1 Tax=Buchnera aphidicola TaxID=9 RepID=UPI003464E4CC